MLLMHIHWGISEGTTSAYISANFWPPTLADSSGRSCGRKFGDCAISGETAMCVGDKKNERTESGLRGDQGAVSRNRHNYKINDISPLSRNLSAKCFTKPSLPRWATTSATSELSLLRTCHIFLIAVKRHHKSVCCHSMGREMYD